jgi:hypothetical protein
MQVIDQKNLGALQATLYKWNGKYILKIERALLEQTYKWSQMDVSSDQEVMSILDNQDFLQRVALRFDQMSEELGLLY